MLAAGIKEIGGLVEVFELPAPRALRAGEVLIEVEAAGVGNWDEIVRTGGWDVGISAPMALGVEAAGTVLAAGGQAGGLAPGDQVLCHSAPLSDQGAWAELFIAPAEALAKRPTNVSWAAAGAFPVPALTAEQVLTEALAVRPGDRLLVHGAGGVTGGAIVQLATLRGLEVIATASSQSAQRVKSLGAGKVIDYRDETWVQQARCLSGGGGVPFVVNALRGGSTAAVAATADGGRFATITGDPPREERGASVANVYVRPDGGQLQTLVELLSQGKLDIQVRSVCNLSEARVALAKVVDGLRGGAVVVVPR
jgi:NADPH:quinone reductase-like Zn-dependent oxidoreductase